MGYSTIGDGTTIELFYRRAGVAKLKSFEIYLLGKKTGMKTKFPTRFPSFSAEDFLCATSTNLLTSSRKRKTLEDRAEKFQAAKFFFLFFFCRKFCFLKKSKTNRK